MLEKYLDKMCPEATGGKMRLVKINTKMQIATRKGAVKSIREEKLK